MERQFCKYARESFLSDVQLNIFADAETKKDLYKYKNNEILRIIKTCQLHSGTDVDNLVNLINKYFSDYETNVYHDDLGKVLIVDNINKYVMDPIDNARLLLTKTEIYQFANSLDRYALKFVVLGLYEGIGAYGKDYALQDLLECDASAINDKENTITLPSGHTFKYSREVINAAIEAANEDYYYDSLDRRLTTVNNGKIIRPKERSDGHIILGYQALHNYASAIKRMSGNKRIGLNRIMASGFYTLFMERLNGKVYHASDRKLVEDILIRYNKTNITDKALFNIQYKYRAVK